MKSLAFLSVFGLSAISSILASPLAARDTENNVLIGYYDGTSYKQKVISLDNPESDKVSGKASFLHRIPGTRIPQSIKVYYAEIIYGLPTVNCDLIGPVSVHEDYDPSDYDPYADEKVLWSMTSQHPFVPYEGHLESVYNVVCYVPREQSSADPQPGTEGTRRYQQTEINIPEERLERA